MLHYPKLKNQLLGGFMSENIGYKLADGSFSTEYKIGDKFKVVFTEGNSFITKGQIVEYTTNDGTDCPEFSSGVFIDWSKLVPIKKKKSKIKNLQKQIDELKELVDKYINTSKEVISKGVTPLWKQVLEQKEFYKGHGQMTLSEITLPEVKELLEDLSNNCGEIENIFYVSLFSEEDGRWSGHVQQSIKVANSGLDKLWLSINTIVAD